MNDYRNFQRPRQSKYFPSRTPLKKHRRDGQKTRKVLSKAHYLAQQKKNKERNCGSTEASVLIRLQHDQQSTSAISNSNDDNEELASLISRIYWFYNLLERLDFDIWRHIIIQNFLFPHEIFGKILVLNKYFHTLFDQKWLINKLANSSALKMYYQSLINKCNADGRKDYNYEYVTSFAQSMIDIINRLSKLGSFDSFCSRGSWNHCECYDPNQKLHDWSYCSLNTIGNYDGNLAGIGLDVSSRYSQSPKLYYLKCWCKYNCNGVKNGYRYLNSRMKMNPYMLIDHKRCKQNHGHTNIQPKKVKRLKNKFKRLLASLFLFTIIYYDPMKKHLLLIITDIDGERKGYAIPKCKQSILNDNISAKWEYYKKTSFKSNIDKNFRKQYHFKITKCKCSLELHEKFYSVRLGAMLWLTSTNDCLNLVHCKHVMGDWRHGCDEYVSLVLCDNYAS